MDAFRNVLKQSNLTVAEGDQLPIEANFRPVQPLGSRTVWRNFKTEPDTVGAATTLHLSLWLVLALAVCKML